MNKCSKMFGQMREISTKMIYAGRLVTPDRIGERRDYPPGNSL